MRSDIGLTESEYELIAVYAYRVCLQSNIAKCALNLITASRVDYTQHVIFICIQGRYDK